MTLNKKSFYADASLLVVAMIWGGGFVVIKDALDDITPLYMMTMRFSFAFIIMGIIFWKNIIKVDRKTLLSGLIIGFFLYTAYGTQTIGLQFTTAGKQAFLTGINVVMVPFLFWLVSRKAPDVYSVFGAFAALVGIGFLTLQNGLSISLGDSLTLVCAFFFACHIVSVGYFAPDADAVALSVIQTGFAAFFFIISALLFEPVPAGISSSAWGAIAYQVLFSTLAAVLIQNIAQKYTPSTHAAIILCLESVFGSILAVIVLGDIFSGKMIFGCVMIFAAIITTETKLEFLRKKKL